MLLLLLCRANKKSIDLPPCLPNHCLIHFEPPPPLLFAHFVGQEAALNSSTTCFVRDFKSRGEAIHGSTIHKSKVRFRLSCDFQDNWGNPDWTSEKDLDKESRDSPCKSSHLCSGGFPTTRTLSRADYATKCSRNFCSPPLKADFSRRTTPTERKEPEIKGGSHCRWRRSVGRRGLLPNVRLRQNGGRRKCNCETPKTLPMSKKLIVECASALKPSDF